MTAKQTETLDALIRAYRTHYKVLANNPPGPKTDRAEERIEKVCQRAEAAGLLRELTRAVL